MKKGDIVEFVTPYEDEKNTTYRIVEIDEAKNWTLIEALTNMFINPTQIAKLSELKLVK